VKASSTRQQIIKVAAGLFAHNGVRRTTMEAIANAAGRGRRTVYMYFSDKAEIYNAVVEMEIDHIIRSLRKILDNDVPLAEMLHSYAFERYQGINSLLRRNPLLVRDFAQSHNRIERLRERLNDDELGIITPFFEKITSTYKDEIKGAPELLAVTFMNMLRGNDRILLKKNNYDEASLHITAACEIFMKGIIV